MNETKWRVHWRNKITGEIKEWSIAGTRENAKKSIAIYDAADTHCTHWLQPDGTAPALKAGTEAIRWRVWEKYHAGSPFRTPNSFLLRETAQGNADQLNRLHVVTATFWIQPELDVEPAKKVEPTRWTIHYRNRNCGAASRNMITHPTPESARAYVVAATSDSWSLDFWLQPEGTPAALSGVSGPIRWRVHSRTKDGKNAGKWIAVHETREQAEATIGSWLAWSIFDYWVQPEVNEKTTPTITLNGATFPPGFFQSNADPLPIWGTGIVSCFPRFSVDPAANPFDPLTVSTMYNPKFSFADFLGSGKPVAAEKKPDPPVKTPCTNEAFTVYRVVQSGAFECGVPQVEWPIDFKDAESARDHAELLKEFFPSLAYWVRTVRGVKVKPVKTEEPKPELPELYKIWVRPIGEDCTVGTTWFRPTDYDSAKAKAAQCNRDYPRNHYWIEPENGTCKPVVTDKPMPEPLWQIMIKNIRGSTDKSTYSRLAWKPMPRADAEKQAYECNRTQQSLTGKWEWRYWAEPVKQEPLGGYDFPESTYEHAADAFKKDREPEKPKPELWQVWDRDHASHQNGPSRTGGPITKDNAHYAVRFWNSITRGDRYFALPEGQKPDPPKPEPLYQVWERTPYGNSKLGQPEPKSAASDRVLGLMARTTIRDRYFYLPDGETPKPYERNWEFHSIFRDSTDSITPYHVVFSQRIGSACTVAKYAFREIAYSHANRLMDLDPRKADAEIDGIYARGKK